VADPNTYQPVMEIIAADPSVRAFSRQYLKIPDWILADSELDCRHRYLYAVLIKYSDISEKNSTLPYPSQETLATECGFSREAIIDWLKKLKERGWISWMRRPNQTNLYLLHGPESVDNNGSGKLAQPNSGNAKLAHEHSSFVTPPPKGGVPHSSDESLAKNAEHDGERRQGSLDRISSGTDQQPLAQSNRGAHETPAVSNQNGRYREADNPFWAQPERQKFFDALYGLYPKMSPKFEAMIAFRTTVTEADTANEEFLKRIWFGLQWWNHKWRKEETEAKYIPAMARWIERRQWEQADVNPETVVVRS
jgi:hypothetical protein